MAAEQSVESEFIRKESTRKELVIAGKIQQRAITLV